MPATIDVRRAAAPDVDTRVPRTLGGLERVRAGAAAVGATVLGAAPHVLHHAGPLAGAALLGGVSGRLLFAAIGFVAAVPMLRRLRGRTGSWRMPAAVLGAMVALFTFSTLIIGPALTGDAKDSSPVKPARPGITQPRGAGHESHHP